MVTDRLNPASMLDRVKRKMGIKTFILPFTDDELLQVLYEDTLPVYSIYFPRYFRKILDVEKLKNVDSHLSGVHRRYYLNKHDFKDIQIIDIEDVCRVETPLDYYDDYSTSSGLDAFNLTASLYQNAVVESMLSTPVIAKFEPPNILNFESNTHILHCGDLEFKFLICHTQDLSTIQYAQREMLFELYKLDLQITLYAELKHYDKIDTTFGEITLKIDDWADAENKRDELILKWKEKFLAFREKTINKL